MIEGLRVPKTNGCLILIQELRALPCCKRVLGYTKHPYTSMLNTIYNALYFSLEQTLKSRGGNHHKPQEMILS